MYNQSIADRGINRSKNPVAERQRTLKTRVMGFCTGTLVQVKTLSTKYQRSQYLGFELYRRAYENRPLKWGERLRRELPLG